MKKCLLKILLLTFLLNSFCYAEVNAIDDNNQVRVGIIDSNIEYKIDSKISKELKDAIRDVYGKEKADEIYQTAIPRFFPDLPVFSGSPSIHRVDAKAPVPPSSATITRETDNYNLCHLTERTILSSSVFPPKADYCFCIAAQQAQSGNSGRGGERRGGRGGDRRDRRERRERK